MFISFCFVYLEYRCECTGKFEKGYISLLSGKTSSKCKVKNGDTILMDRKSLIDFLG